MSVFSGKCDLYDHMCGLGGWFNEEGKPVEFGDENTPRYFSDEYLGFLEFKKRTNGTLHQHKKIEVTDYNLRFVKDHCTGFDYIKHFIRVEDKRTKEGYREKSFYTYMYYDREYTSLKELNKRGVYIVIDIHFDTILDLIPYYPYLVVCGGHSDGKSYIVISNEPFPIEERDDHYKYGYDSKMWEHYNKKLQDHYKEIVLRYFNPEGREHIEELTFDENRQAKVSKPIDENFDVEWDTNKPHWTSPKVIDYDKGIIEISEEDYNYYLGKTMKVKYVEKKEYPLYLG